MPPGEWLVTNRWGPLVTMWVTNVSATDTTCGANMSRLKHGPMPAHWCANATYVGPALIQLQATYGTDLRIRHVNRNHWTKDWSLFPPILADVISVPYNSWLSMGHSISSFSLCKMYFTRLYLAYNVWDIHSWHKLVFLKTDIFIYVTSINKVRSKHGTFTQCCFNVGPTSKTVGQHWNSLGWMPRVCWVGEMTRLSYCVVIMSTWTVYWYQVKVDEMTNLCYLLYITPSDQSVACVTKMRG